MINSSFTIDKRLAENKARDNFARRYNSQPLRSQGVKRRAWMDYLVDTRPLRALFEPACCVETIPVVIRHLNGSTRWRIVQRVPGALPISIASGN